MKHHLIFSVGNLTCALPLAAVQVVLRMVQLTPSPGQVRGFAGTISFHGDEIPVYSLRSLFSRPGRPPSLRDMLVIVRTGTAFTGLWVDRVTGVFEFPVPATAGTETASASPEFPGMYVHTDGTMVIHDLAEFLAHSGTTGIPLPVPAAVATDSEPPAEADGTIPEREMKAVLEQRAWILARPEDVSDKAQIVDVLFFRLVYKEYAMEMKYIREVVLPSEITPVPGTPDFISGICAVRGEIISLVDPRIFFSIPERGLTDLNRVIIITDGRTTFGILADYITGLGTIPLDRLRPVKPGMTSIDPRYLRGMAGESLILVDAAAILSDEKMIVDDSA
jgi:chemotaxis signal transduction protein